MSTASSLPSSVSKASTGSPRFALIIAACVLVAGIVLAFVGMRPPPPRTFHGSVKDLLPPAEIVARDGWRVEYLPIADTPEAKAKVNELLNYDDAVFAVYTRGTERISIYLAYWSPGKMSHRLVAGHTPDVCWVGAGWRIEEAASVTLAPVGGGRWPVDRAQRTADGSQLAKSVQLVASNQSLVTSNEKLVTSNQQLVASRQALVTSNEQLVASPQSLVTSRESLALRNQQLATSPLQLVASNELLVSSPKLLALIAQPGEYREMSLNGRTEHVVFWHLLDGIARSYGTAGAPPWHATFTDLFTQAFKQRPEQLFVRISAPT